VLLSIYLFSLLLDDYKKQLVFYSKEALQIYLDALKYSNRETVRPDTCRVYRSEVNVPVYRRFDFPNIIVNQLLSKFGGMYPNEKLVIDRGLYLFEFSLKNKTQFVIVYHACHPVSRKDPNLLSSDYVAQIRKAVRERFKIETCLFLLGCAGDIRPNFSKKRISETVKKTLESAIANAENNHDLDVDSLIVSEAFVGKALVMKRFSPRARGRVGRIEKPFSHLTIIVREVEEAA
jgi:ribosomal protein L22